MAILGQRVVLSVSGREIRLFPGGASVKSASDDKISAQEFSLSLFAVYRGGARRSRARSRLPRRFPARGTLCSAAAAERAKRRKGVRHRRAATTYYWSRNCRLSLGGKDCRDRKSNSPTFERAPAERPRQQQQQRRIRYFATLAPSLPANFIADARR